MVFLHAKAPLTSAERTAKRRLVIQDTLALLGLFAITGVLAVLTFLLFRSYSQHEKDLGERWLRRGNAALAAGQPIAAVNALRSALAFQPENRQTQIKLAEALAGAGRVQEAIAYFNSLWDKEPGSGPINLQLARLTMLAPPVRGKSARNASAARALEYYHAAIYGTWEGDGAQRRRQVRLELVRLEISRGMFADARNELLIAAGNADNTNTEALLEVAALLEQAHAPNDALRVYRQILGRKENSFAALAGAGRTSFELSRYRAARQFLERAVALPDASKQPDYGEDRQELAQSSALLDLFPGPMSPARQRVARLLRARSIAGKRLLACVAAQEGGAAAVSPNTGQATAQASGGATLNNRASSPPLPPELAVLNARWQAEPKAPAALLRDPDLQQSELELIYDTELKTSHVCGAPTGDDALLLRIAQSPDTVEQR
ncbi:MAG: tetratricopeptide repeat protein [Acidobacteriaceae bacterium]